MTSQDRQQVKELMHDVLSGVTARIESQNEIINYKLDSIELHMSKMDMRILGVEDNIRILEDADLVHGLACPHKDMIVDIKVKQDKFDAVSRFAGKSVWIGSMLIGIMFGIYTLLKELIGWE